MAWRCSNCNKIMFSGKKRLNNLCKSCFEDYLKSKTNSTLSMECDESHQKANNLSERTACEKDIHAATAIHITDDSTTTVQEHQSDWVPITVETKNKYMNLVIRNANSYQSDLVEMSTNPSCCCECAKYQGRIYSITGRDQRFPKLPDVFIQTGKLHKDCLHTVYNFIEGNRPIYVEGDIFEVSNRPFEDNRSDYERNDYFYTKESVTPEAMKQIEGLPFVFDQKFHYDDKYPYMNISGKNLETAHNHIESVTRLIIDYAHENHSMPVSVITPPNDYTKIRLCCTPFTPKMKISREPMHLSFGKNAGNPNNSAVGEIYYSKSGEINRASICFWKNHKSYQFQICRKDGVICITDAKIIF